jgi:hypothetical protein
MSVKESIITELKQGVRKKAEVIACVQNKETVTIQAVYKELRRLEAEEVVLDANKTLSLTLSYVKGEYAASRHVLEAYTHNISFDDILQITKGKSQTFTFSSLVDLDLFWTQAFILLERILPENSTTYSIIPHDWFYYARPHSDEVWTQSKTKDQRLIITHPAEIDWKVARIRREQGYLFTGDVNPLKQSECQYRTIVSDWIFEVEFDARVATRLNQYVSSLKNLPEVNENLMKEIVQMKGDFKIKLSNNPQKARELTKKVTKYFE